MPSLSFHADELAPIVQQVVDATLRRMAGRQSRDAQGRILLSRSEAAEALGVSGSTLDRLRQSGLPSVKLDGRILFRPEALREWAAERERRAEA